MKPIKGCYRFYWTVILGMFALMALSGVSLVPSWGGRIILMLAAVGCIALIFWLYRLNKKEHQSRNLE